MGRRYLRRFRCVDCGEETEKRWEAPRPLICTPCAQVRAKVAYEGARAAVAAHTRECRIRLAARRQAPALTVEGAAEAAAGSVSGKTMRGEAAS